MKSEVQFCITKNPQQVSKEKGEKKEWKLTFELICTSALVNEPQDATM